MKSQQQFVIKSRGWNILKVGLFLTLFPFICGTLFSQNSLETNRLPDTLYSIDTIQIGIYQTRSRSISIPGSLSELSGAALDINDNTNFATIINTLPGVFMQSGTYGTNRLVIRGMGSRTPFNTNRIRSYLNDIPMTGSEGLSNPEEFDVQSIGKIELIKGPSSALYGSGLGGTLAMSSPKNPTNSGGLIAQYGSFGTMRTNAYVSYQKKSFSLWTSLNHFQSDGYRDNNFHRRSSMLTVAQWTRDKWVVQATLLGVDVFGRIPSSIGETLFRTQPEAADAGWANIRGYKKYNRGVAGLSLSRKINNAMTNTLTVFGRWLDNYEARPFNNLDDLALSTGLRNRLNYYSEKLEVMAGFEWLVEQYSWKLSRVGSNVLFNENQEIRHQLNLFGIAYYKPVDKVNISMALASNHIRYRLDDLFPDNDDQSGRRRFPAVLSPRLGINYAPFERFAVYASAGHGFSMPSPEETLLPGGEVNPNILPEQGYQFELGSRYFLAGELLEVDLGVYHIELKDLLVTQRITEDIFTGINAGRSRHYGLELQLKSSLLNRREFPGSLHANLSFTLSENRFVEFEDRGQTYDGNHLPGIPRSSTQLVLGWKPVRYLEFLTHLQYIGSQFITDDNKVDYPSFFLANFRVSIPKISLGKQSLKIYFGANNITDTKYASMLLINALAFGNREPRYYYPGLPRNYYMGLHYRF